MHKSTASSNTSSVVTDEPIVTHEEQTCKASHHPTGAFSEVRSCNLVTSGGYKQ